MTGLVIIVMLIWLVIIQYKLSELTDSLKELKDNLLKENIHIPIKSKDTTEEKAGEKSEEQKPKIESISDIPDEAVLSSNSVPLPKYIEKTIEKEDKSDSFENIFLGNIFNKIGAFAILVALIILIKIVSPYFEFTPQLKITLSYLAGAAMMFGALKLHNKENMKNYSEVLLGTGFGAMFISTYCASGIFHLYNMPVMCTIATILLLLAFYLADKLKTISMIVISLLAGYMNIICLSSQFNISESFLFGYLIFINILSIVYTCKNQERNLINSINLPLTSIAALIYCSKIPLIFPLILWAIYVIYDFAIFKDKKSNNILNFINLAVFSLILIKVFNKEYNLVAYSELGVALIYAIIAYIKRSKIEDLKNYIQLSLASAYLFIYFICDKSPTTKCFAWSIETVILAFYAYKYKFKFLGTWTVATFGSAFCSIVPIDGVLAIRNIGKYTPIWNIRLLMFTPIITSSALSYYLLKKSASESLIKISDFFKFISITSIYLYMGLELNNLITLWYTGENTSAKFLNKMTNIILAFVYTINLKKLSNSTNSNPIISKIGGFFGIISTIALLFIGIHYTPLKAFIPLINIRTVAFLSAIATSILYAKWTENKIYKYIAIFLGFILLHYEMNDVITKYDIIEGQYLVSLCWILYAGTITTLGILQNKDFFKNSGIGLCILSIAKILIFDLSNIDILYKFIAIITLGIILMILSYMYNKKYSK